MIVQEKGFPAATLKPGLLAHTAVHAVRALAAQPQCDVGSMRMRLAAMGRDTHGASKPAGMSAGPIHHSVGVPAVVAPGAVGPLPSREALQYSKPLRMSALQCIGLKAASEPEIYGAIRFGAVLENVVFDEFTREVDYDSKCALLALPCPPCLMCAPDNGARTLTCRGNMPRRTPNQEARAPRHRRAPAQMCLLA